MRDFAFADMARATRQAYCRVCHAAYRRAHYLAHRQEYIDREVDRIRRKRNTNRGRVFDHLMTHPCVDCGETDPLVLDFDHRDPKTKVREVAFLVVRKSWTSVLREIAKCDVRCSNCHLRRTAVQFGWQKARTEGASDVPRSAVSSFAGNASSSSDGAEIDVFAVKTCTECGETKPISAFHFKSKAMAKRKAGCRDCRNKYGRGHYRRNRPVYLEKAELRRGVVHALHRTRLLDHLKSNPCVDCGETDPVVLQFDHRDRAEKIGTVSRMAMEYSWGQVVAEIAKCDVRCGNCHRRRTAVQFGWTKLARLGTR